MTAKTRNPSLLNHYHDQERLLVLQLMLCEKMDELVHELGLRVTKSRRLYMGCCPIHLGDNPSGLNLYIEGDSIPGYWRCNTRHCHSIFKPTILGLVRGVLSQQRCNWTWTENKTERERQPQVAWKDAVDWCCQFLGVSLRNLEVNHGEMEKRRFAGAISHFTRQPQYGQVGLTRDEVRAHLNIPACYFRDRGFSADVLDRYDVGLYLRPGRPLSDRAVVPIYDNDYRFVVGFTGRSIHPKCEKCRRWHPAGPCVNQDWARTSKWFNQGIKDRSFNRDSSLYNFWFAKKEIAKIRTVVLVEGPGDVWRLTESGVENAVAMFGTELSDEQQVLLEMSGAMNVVVLTDSDEAGNDAKRQLKERLGRSFRLHFPLLTCHDVGEMSVEKIRSEIVPVIKPIIERSF